MSMKKALCVVAFLGLVASGAAFGDAPSATGKKLIEYGWDVPTPSFIAEHVRDMEQRPFDGLIFRLEGGSSVFDPTPWAAERFQKDLDAIAKIEWKTFTDNFVIMLAASDQDWFDDAQWQAIAGNTRLIARAARLARCVGICFDAEPYGTNPWSYTKAVHHDTKSFDEYTAIARKRGAQFIRAVETELPNPKVLTFFLNSYFLELCAPMSEELRKERLSKQYYSLLPAFLEGMLEASGPQTEFIDGNEEAYYYTNKLDYLAVYHGMTQRVRPMVDPALWPAYRAKVRAGQSLYVDQYFGLRQTERTLGNSMTAEERPKWFEHNTYWALTTTDAYVWCYSERMNWWTNTDVPPGAEDALRLARAAVETGKRLRFDLQPIIELAKQREAADNAPRLVRRKAEVYQLPPNVAPPTIDGDLGEPAWREALVLEPFVPLLAQDKTTKVTAQTEVRMTYDSKTVYVSFRCQEPNLAQLVADAKAGDSLAIFEGDVVEILVCTEKQDKYFRHFAVNARGAGWAGLHEEGAAQPLPVAWERAGRIGTDAWTVEVAIPWPSLGVTAPSPGLQFRANLARGRDHGKELSTWRSMNSGFLEPENFGMWEFE